MNQIFKRLVLLLCVFLPLLTVAQFHNYCNFDLAAVPPGVTSVIDVQANDDFNPPPGVINYYPGSVTCDYSYFFGAFSSREGGTWSILNQDSIAYTPPAGMMEAWDRLVYGACAPTPGSGAHDSASVHIYITCMATANDPQFQSGVSIFPNPVGETLRLTGPSLRNIGQVSIWTLDGKQVVAPQPWRDSLTVGHLPSGLYLLRMEVGTQPYYLRLSKL
jgi:hypothetical protein